MAGCGQHMWCSWSGKIQRSASPSARQRKDNSPACQCLELLQCHLEPCHIQTAAQALEHCNLLPQSKGVLSLLDWRRLGILRAGCSN